MAEDGRSCKGEFFSTRLEGDDEFPGGKLIIVLDDDAGRTLGMCFATRRDAPDPEYVGFTLALLLRVKCRDFHNFSIRIR